MSDLNYVVTNVDTKNIKYLNEIDNKIKKVFNDTANNYGYLGFLLNEVEICKLYELGGYSDVYEFAEAVYGMKKSNAFACIKIADRFYDSNIQSIKPEFKNFSFSQLTEFISLNEKQILEFTPENTIKEIRLEKKYLKLIEDMDDLFINRIDELFDFVKNYFNDVDLTFESTLIKCSDLQIEKLVSRNIFLNNSEVIDVVGRLDIKYKDKIIYFQIAFAKYNLLFEEHTNVANVCQDLRDLKTDVERIYAERNQVVEDIKVEEQITMDEIITPEVIDVSSTDLNPTINKLILFVNYMNKKMNKEVELVLNEIKATSTTFKKKDVTYYSINNYDNIQSVLLEENLKIINKYKTLKSLPIEVLELCYLFKIGSTYRILFLTSNIKMFSLTHFEFFDKLGSISFLNILNEDTDYDTSLDEILSLKKILGI